MLALCFALLALASGCASMRGQDYNNWGVPERSGDGTQWHWTPW
jgi:hypothetical protein